MHGKWYVAFLLMICRTPETDQSVTTCDEQIRVIRAADREDAFLKGLQLGKNEEHSYLNMNSETVYWEFAGLLELAEIDSDALLDGTEIHSRIFEHGDPLRLVPQQKALSAFLSNAG